MPNFEDKVVVVIGGTAGIGLATAHAFVDEGAAVHVTGRSADSLAEALSGLGDRATGTRADVSDLDQLSSVFDDVRNRYGRIDVLHVNAAAGAGFETTSSVTPTRFAEMFDTNTRGPFFAVQWALDLMPAGASIVLTGSAPVRAGAPGHGLYAASKAAVWSLVRSWAVEFADRGIRVNLVDPGPIDTRSWDDIGPELRDQVVATIPAGRFGRPEEVARAVLFLADPGAGYVNGIALGVDGGFARL